MKTLTASGLKKSFANRVIVNDVSIELRQGEILGLLGPNGAGKTTTFDMLVGLIRCDRGKICIDGQDVTHLPIEKRALLGMSYLPQQPSVFRKLSVYNNLMAILELDKTRTPTQRQNAAQALLENFRLKHLSHSLGYSLSGGERRRLEIARAICLKPSFLLLDEPFAGVDPISVVELKTLIKQLAEQHIGVLITDHNIRDTLAICQRACIVHAGKVLCEGSCDKIINDEMVRQVYLGEDF